MLKLGNLKVQFIGLGDRYGRHAQINYLTPMLEFYDERIKGGQYITRLPVDFFYRRELEQGIRLDERVEVWALDAADIVEIRNYLVKRGADNACLL